MIPAASPTHRASTPMLLSVLLSSIATTSRPQEAPDVRLIVMISVDQLIPEQLERLGPHFRGGYRRLLDHGRVHLGGLLAHAATETGPGHAALGTGVHPSRSGIIGNAWMAPDGTGAYCAGDPEASELSNAGTAPAPGSSSPATLLVDGLADHLLALHPDAKSVGISFKDRAAILSTGRGTDWAFWWSPAKAGFVSSTWYGDALPEWVAEFNEGWPFEAMDDAELFDGERFVWRSSLPADLRGTRTAADERRGESPAGGGTRFPHAGPAVNDSPAEGELSAVAGWIYTTAYADRLVIQLAERALEAMELGADATPDFLFVGLSATDAVGHSYGPFSHEVTDVLLRDDLWLGELFDRLDERVGKDRWVLGLSSDHGVLPLPEQLAEMGHDAGRIPPGEIVGAVTELRAELTDIFGTDVFLAASGGTIRFDSAAMSEAGLDPAEVRATAAEALAAKSSAIARVFTREDIEGDRSDDPLLIPIRCSYHRERSSDLEVVLRRGWLPYPVGTSHGSPYDYDRSVPLVFLGPSIEAGVTYDPCYTVDVLPTLFHAAGLAVPDGLDGKVLD